MNRLNYNIDEKHLIKYANPTPISSSDILNTQKAFLTCSMPQSYDVQKAFFNDQNEFNNNISRELFRMGWETIAFLTFKSNTLTLNHLYHYDGASSFNCITSINNKPITQITTQAVDTCTLVLIKATVSYEDTDDEKSMTIYEDKYILAHVGSYEQQIDPMITHIKTKLSQWNIEKLMVYASYTDGPDSSISSKFKAAWGEHFSLFRNPLGDTYINPYLSHMEFGICAEDSVIKYFGDITLHPAPTDLSDATKRNNWHCVLFETASLEVMDSLKDLISVKSL